MKPPKTTSQSALSVSIRPEALYIAVGMLLLAFVLRNPNTIGIPKSSNPKHTLENAKALTIDISTSDWAKIDREFPAPTTKEPLDMQ